MGMYDNMNGNSSMIVTVSKDELLTALKKNREKHIADHKRAIIGWRESVKKETARLAKKASKGKCDVSDIMDLMSLRDKPKSHKDDYDTAIEMLDWHTGDDFKIEREQFEKYVLDRWDWKSSFRASTAKYIGG